MSNIFNLFILESLFMATLPFTKEQIIDRFRIIHGDSYDYSDMVYLNVKTHVTIICSHHGKFKQTPKNHLVGNGCKLCSFDKKRESQENVIKKFISVHGNRYSYENVKYISTDAKVFITCNTHGDFLQKPSKHIEGYGCPSCKFQNLTLNQVDAVNNFKLIHNDLYDYSKVVYINAKTKINIICSLHGEFNQTPSDHMQGAGCPKCGIARRTISCSDILSRFNKVHGDLYDYSNLSYINSLNKVTIKCYKHGEFEQSINCHSNGKGCPKCKSSKGENKIRLFLENNGISYIEQYPICKNPETDRNLRSDFYLKSFNTIIEYDGRQHFEEVSYFGGETNFENVLKRDSIKNQFCIENKIEMIRISYKEFKQIDDILSCFLS